MIKKISKFIGLIAIIALVWWYLYRNRQAGSLSQPSLDITVPSYKDDTPETDSDLVDQEASPQQTKATKIDHSSKQDDLTRINGIGPKISEIFDNVGINTYQQLADIDSTEIQGILEAANIRLAPRYETWSKQAQFATSGDWEGLLKYLEYQKKNR
jgi:predicted flap endonuclease-1-like 5' DNA nuclease